MIYELTDEVLRLLRENVESNAKGHGEDPHESRYLHSPLEMLELLNIIDQLRGRDEIARLETERDAIAKSRDAYATAYHDYVEAARSMPEDADAPKKENPDGLGYECPTCAIDVCNHTVLRYQKLRLRANELLEAAIYEHAGHSIECENGNGGDPCICGYLQFEKDVSEFQNSGK